MRNSREHRQGDDDTILRFCEKETANDKHNASTMSSKTMDAARDVAMPHVKNAPERNPTYLCRLLLNAVQNCRERRIGETALLASLFVVFEPSAHAFWAVIESIPKRLVNGLDTLAASHKDLKSNKTLNCMLCLSMDTHSLKGSGACPWMRGYKHWLGRHIVLIVFSWYDRRTLFQDRAVTSDRQLQKKVKRVGVTVMLLKTQSSEEEKAFQVKLRWNM